MESVINRNVEKLRELRQGIPSNPQNRVNLYAHRVVAEEATEEVDEKEPSIDEQMLKDLMARMEVGLL